MKILILNYEYPPIGGGAANATSYLLKEFSKNSDIEIDLVTSSLTNKIEYCQVTDKIKIIKLPVDKKSIHYWRLSEIIRYSWMTYLYLRKKDLGEYNLIHTFFGVPCGAIAFWFRKKIPYIVSLRGSDVPGFNKRFAYLYIFLKPIIRVIWRNSARVIANSQGLKDLAFKTDNTQKISIIYNGVDTTEFSKVPLNITKKKFTVLCVSRLIKRKGIDHLITAIPEIISAHKNMCVVIIGEGNQEHALKELSHKLHVEQYVEFLGYVAHENLAQYYQSSNVFVLPSKNEGMSNTILEAMAAGLPIITTSTGGTQELIDNNGIIIPSEDSSSISKAILSYIQRPELNKMHSINSRNISEKFNWSTVADNYLKIYMELS